MRSHYLALSVLLMTMPAWILTKISTSDNNNLQPAQQTNRGLESTTSIILNVDGDVSMTEEKNRAYWNPHSVGLANVSNWKIILKDEVTMFMQTTANESGHIAAGAWWTMGFKSKEKLQLYTSSLVHVIASFQAKIVSADCDSRDGWLRVALACAVQRGDSSVVYTEMDLWDSPTVLTCPSGNIMMGGNIIYKGGDVLEYRLGQISVGGWTSYRLELTDCINRAWSLKTGDVLESVYFVVEAAGAAGVTVKFDDLWLARVG